MGEAKQEAKEQAEKAARSPWGHGLARWGLISRGALYVLVGAIAVHVSVGGGERVRDRGGALATLTDTWLGKGLVALLAVGLLGYAAWRFLEAALGRTLESEERESWWRRLGCAARGFWYLGLFGVAISALFGADGRAARKRRIATPRRCWTFRSDAGSSPALASRSAAQASSTSGAA